MNNDNINFYKGLIDNLSYPFILIHEEKKPIYCSSSFLNYIKYSSLESLPADLSKIIPALTQIDLAVIHKSNQSITLSDTTVIDNLQNNLPCSVTLSPFLFEENKYINVKIEFLKDLHFQNKFRSMVESSTDYIMRFDKDGRYTYVNPAALNATGIKEDKILFKTHLEAGFDKTKAAFWDNNIKQVFETGKPIQIELEWEGPNGMMYMDWRLSPEFDENGDVQSVIGINRDITKQKIVELALKQNESRLNLLTQYTPTYLMELDKDGNFLYINRTYEGITEADVIGTSIFQWLPLEAGKLVKNTLENVSTFKDTLTIEYDVPDLRNNIISYIAQFTPVFNEKNELIKIVSTATDYTSLKATKRALKETDIKYKAFFDQAAVGVGELSSVTGKIINVNKRYCEILGYTAEELKQLTFQNLTCPDDLQEDLSCMKLLIEGKIRSFTLEKRLIKKDGKNVWVNLSVAPLWQAGESPSTHIAVVEDINDKKIGEEKLVKYNQDLELKNKELEQFVFIASHDLQEPLRTISSLTEVLKNEYSHQLNEIGNKYIDFIKLSTGRMTMLIKDLLDYSQIGKSK